MVNFRHALAAILVSSSLVAACTNPTKTGPRHFDAPQGIAIASYAPNASTSPVPFGFVADPGHFAIRRIDLLHRHLIEPRFPVGRALGPVLAHTGSSGTVDALWGLDRANPKNLVRIDPAQALSPTLSVAPTASACCAIEGIDLRSGLTATQTWTVTYRASLDRWEVTGSGTGVQKKFAKTNRGYESDAQEVRFRVQRTGSAVPVDGETMSFSTSNGVTDVPIITSGSLVNAIALDANTGALAVENPPAVVVFDLASGNALQTFGFPAGAVPAALESAPDGSALYVSDLGNPVVYRLNTSGAIGTWTLDTFPAPVPMRDLAVTGDGARLLAMAADADDVFVFTAPDLVPVDFTPLVPGFDPLSFPTTIRALAAGRIVHPTRGTGVPIWPVLLTSHGGNAFVLQGATGCIDFNDVNGARTTGVSYRDALLPSAPSFNTDVFRTSRCGGIVRTETWSFIFDGLTHSYRVQGSVSGEQVGRAVEGVPYTTDKGEITVEIDGNAALPTDDGDTFFVSTVDGIAPIQIGLVPGKPVFFSLPPDANGEVFERALVPNIASDTISDVDLDNRRVIANYR